jgi:hypothetical protein
MNDYRLCDLCRTLSYDLLDRPGGCQHYKDVKLLIAEANADPPCWLCWPLFQALTVKLRISHSTKSLTQLADESVQPLNVRLKINAKATPHQERPESYPLISGTWNYRRGDDLAVWCGEWDHETSKWVTVRSFFSHLIAYRQQGGRNL